MNKVDINKGEIYRSFTNYVVKVIRAGKKNIRYQYINQNIYKKNEFYNSSVSFIKHYKLSREVFLECFKIDNNFKELLNIKNIIE